MIIRLNKKLYKRRAIADTLAEFDDFGSFALRTEDDYFVIEISDPDPDFVDVLPHEIANFALANTIEARRV